VDGIKIVNLGGWLLCARNARPEKALFGRAQWEIERDTLFGKNEQAWRGY